jgi:hypothetical protein
MTDNELTQERQILASLNLVNQNGQHHYIATILQKVVITLSLLLYVIIKTVATTAVGKTDIMVPAATHFLDFGVVVDTGGGCF